MKTTRILASAVLLFAALLLTSLSAAPAPAAETRRAFPEQEFQRRFDEWKAATDDTERLSRAEASLFPRGVSSAQVKRMALAITNEDSRIEFAAAAYRHTVDPENFYAVYDAFQTFSKVFRLHDRIQWEQRSAPVTNRGPGTAAPRPAGPPPLTDKELGEILASLKRESFDDSKLALAKVVGAGARGRIASRQVLEMLRLFSFDDRRLECAKAAADWVIDPAEFHTVYAAFTFESSRTQLSKFLDVRAGRSSTPARP